MGKKCMQKFVEKKKKIEDFQLVESELSWKVNLAFRSTKNGNTWWQCGVIKRLGRIVENEREGRRMLRGCTFPAIYYIFPLRKRDERVYFKIAIVDWGASRRLTYIEQLSRKKIRSIWFRFPCKDCKGILSNICTSLTKYTFSPRISKQWSDRPLTFLFSKIFPD